MLMARRMQGRTKFDRIEFKRAKHGSYGKILDVFCIPGIILPAG
jgi:hypothetical protein